MSTETLTIPTTGHQRSNTVALIMVMMINASFFGTLSIFILYASKYLHLSDVDAFKLLGGYVGLAYLMPVFGGAMADKLLNTKLTIILGLALLTLGFFGIAFSAHHISWLKISLALAVCGHGFIGPNLIKEFATFIKLKSNNLYQSYLRYYFADTIGQAIGGVGCSFLGVYVGYNIAFLLAGVFLLVALYCYTLINKGQIKIAFMNKEGQNALLAIALTLALIMISIRILYTDAAYLAVFIAFILTNIFVAYIFYKSDQKTRKDLRLLLLTLLLGLIVITCIWQSTGLLNLFTDRYVNRHFGTLVIPASAFDSLDPIFSVLLAIVVMMIAKKYIFHFSSRKLLVNVNFGLYAIGIGILILALGITLTLPALQKLNLNWIVVYYVFQATAGIFVIPTMMAANLQLAPQAYKGYFLGCFELVIGVSIYVATAGGKYLDSYIKAQQAHSANAVHSLLIYKDYFYIVAGVIFLCAITLTFFLKRGGWQSV